MDFYWVWAGLLLHAVLPLAVSKSEQQSTSFIINPDCPVGVDCARLCLPAGDKDSAHTAAVGKHGGGQVAVVAANVGAPVVVVVADQVRLRWPAPVVCDGPLPRFALEAPPGLNGTAVAVAVTALWRFDDAGDTASLSSASEVERVDTGALRWSPAVLADGGSSVRMCTNGDGDNRLANVLGQHGTLCFRVWYGSDSGRDALPPRLLLPFGCAHFELELKGLSDDHFGRRTRFAAQLTALALLPHANATLARLQEHVSVNDQYSPGIFRTVNVKYGANADQAFVQWKPAVYKNSSRERSDLTQSGYESFKTEINTEKDPFTSNVPDFVMRFFSASASTSHNNVSVASLNVTFGYPNDKWVASVGIGSPPEDSLSAGLLALLVTSVSLALLCALAAVVGVLLLRRRKAGSFRLHDQRLDGDAHGFVNAANEVDG